MTDVRDTDPTAPETETLDEASTEVSAADLPMVDQEADEDEDDGEPIVPNGKWARDLSGDYNTPAHRISLATAFNRRLKRNYMWIFAIQLIAYFGKLSLHPSAAGSFATIVERAAIGPIPGNVVLAIGGIYYAGLSAFAIFWPMIDSGERSQRSDALKALVDELGPDMN